MTDTSWDRTSLKFSTITINYIIFLVRIFFCFKSFDESRFSFEQWLIVFKSINAKLLVEAVVVIW